MPAASFRIRRQPLRFDCTLCTDCCTLYIPLIVSEDVRRIVHHTGLRASDFVRFYSPAQVEMPANDRTWIRTREGKRALGLRKMSGGACYFHEGPFCRVNDVKPLLCRMYPFQPVNPAPLAGVAGAMCQRTTAEKFGHGAFDCLEALERKGAAKTSAARKLVACLMTVLSGGSAGCEGAVGQAGASAGRTIACRTDRPPAPRGMRAFRDSSTGTAAAHGDR